MLLERCSCRGGPHCGRWKMTTTMSYVVSSRRLHACHHSRLKSRMATAVTASLIRKTQSWLPTIRGLAHGLRTNTNDSSETREALPFLRQSYTGVARLAGDLNLRGIAPATSAPASRGSLQEKLAARFNTALIANDLLVVRSPPTQDHVAYKEDWPGATPKLQIFALPKQCKSDHRLVAVTLLHGLQLKQPES